MKFYTYRLKEKPSNLDTLEIQETPVVLDDGDKFLVFISGELSVLGLYKKENNKLALEKKLNGKLSDYYKHISCVESVGDRTYKMFAKPVRELETSDYDRISSL